MIKVVLFVTRFPPLHAILRWILEINNSLLTKTLTRQTVLNKVHDFVVTLTKDRAIETARVKQEPSLAKLVLCRRLETMACVKLQSFFSTMFILYSFWLFLSWIIFTILIFEPICLSLYLLILMCFSSSLSPFPKCH